MSLKNIKIAPFITVHERQSRLERLRENMSSSLLDGIILTPGSNLRYMTGLAWGETERLVCLLITQTSVIFICPKFEDTALISCFNVPVDDLIYWEEHECPYQAVASLLAQLKCRKIGLNADCSFGHAVNLQQCATYTMIEPAQKCLAPLRARKTSAELALLSSAMQITLEVHKQVFEWVKPGMRPSEVKTEIDRLHRKAGADNGSSFCAVQFGEATSHPHGVPGDPALKSGELILIDTGCTVDGYNSDITRTYALDQVEEDIETFWRVEKEAQAAAFDLAAPGIACELLDMEARKILQSHDLGPDYNLPGLPHRLGHGIGLDIHEGPYLVRGDKTPLEPGMCFSNEPMIVVPGRFGIRLEDHFYITESGAKWFTEPQPSLYSPFL